MSTKLNFFTKKRTPNKLFQSLEESKNPKFLISNINNFKTVMEEEGFNQEQLLGIIKAFQDSPIESNNIKKSIPFLTAWCKNADKYIENFNLQQLSLILNIASENNYLLPIKFLANFENATINKFKHCNFTVPQPKQPTPLPESIMFLKYDYLLNMIEYMLPNSVYTYCKNLLINWEKEKADKILNKYPQDNNLLKKVYRDILPEFFFQNTPAVENIEQPKQANRNSLAPTLGYRELLNNIKLLVKLKHNVSSDLIQLWQKMAIAELPYLDTKLLSKSIYFIALAGYTPAEDFWQSFEHAAIKKLKDFHPKDLSNLVFSYSLVGRPVHDLFTAQLQQVDKKVWGIKDLYQIWYVAQAGASLHEELVKHANQSLNNFIKNDGLSDIHNKICHALNKIQYKNEKRSIDSIKSFGIFVHSENCMIIIDDGKTDGYHFDLPSSLRLSNSIVEKDKELFYILRISQKDLVKNESILSEYLQLKLKEKEAYPSNNTTIKQLLSDMPSKEENTLSHTSNCNLPTNINNFWRNLVRASHNSINKSLGNSIIIQ
ncbi:hypothetical protein NOVO_07690 [Rickettsiales bacterium Ac37b]|nr:hypothetical protein NOVO_07690 [Rickettsiales bacterium Ac37b]